MNLTNLFNFNYFKQNIKKSKAFLAFFIGIIPIMNVLILILSSKNEAFIPSLETLSLINYPCSYILPIIISVCLFGYVFKKKSVDFVNSMPLSRKTIFATNTIGGILLILLLNFINALLIFILSITISNISIPFSMIIDYFLIWSLIYTFVFVVSNIAVSLSGNMITSIAITLLILFLIPFLDSYISFKDLYINPSNYMVEGSEVSNLTPIIENNYTLPYGFLFQIVVNNHANFNIINTIPIVKMIILSIIYIIIGFYLFKNRKMEVSETSFKNTNVHNAVKCLTLIPFMILFYEVARVSDITVILILLAMMLGYYFIFDLITRRNIPKLSINILFFIGFVILSSIILTIVNSTLDKKEITINEKDIKSVNIISYNYDNAYNFSSKLRNIELTDKNIIKNVINNSNNIMHDDTCKDYTRAILNLNNNKKYEIFTCLDSLNLENNKDIKEEFKNIDFDKIYALSIDNQLVDNEIIEQIKTALNNTNITTNLDSSNDNTINAYSYVDHKLITYSFNYKMSKELEQTYLNTVNKKLIDKLDEKEIYSAYYYDSYIDDPVNFQALRNIIKQNPTVDVSKEYITVYIYTNVGALEYSTNKIEEIQSLFND